MGLLLPALVALANAAGVPDAAAAGRRPPRAAQLRLHLLERPVHQPGELGPLLTGIAVSLVWAVAATALAYVALHAARLHQPGLRRLRCAARSPSGSCRCSGVLGRLRPGWSPRRPRPSAPGSTAGKLQRSLATSFAHLYRRAGQRGEPSERHRGAAAGHGVCNKGAGLVAQEGPGNDWRCVRLLASPRRQRCDRTAIYQLDVNPNGRYVADGDGPNEVNGYFVVHTPYGDAPNPLWQFDGLVDLLSTTSKG